MAKWAVLNFRGRRKRKFALLTVSWLCLCRLKGYQRELQPPTSSVAVSLVGGYSTLEDEQVATNLNTFVLKPLGATLFLDVDFDVDDEIKEIFPRPVTTQAAKISRLKEVVQTFVLTSHNEHKASNTSSCATSKHRLASNIATLRPQWQHLHNCLTNIRATESMYHKKFDWVWIARPDIMYFPSPNIAHLVEEVSTVPIAWVDIFKEADKTEIGGRVGIFNRPALTIYGNLVEQIEYMACNGKMDRHLCLRPHTPECLIALFWKSHPEVDIRSIRAVVDWQTWRRCGSPADCIKAAHRLQRICHEVFNMPHECARARQTTSYYNAFPIFLM